MCVKFELSSSTNFFDIRNPKFTLGALRPPHAIAEKIVILEKSTCPCLNVCKISTFISHSSRDIKRVPNFTIGRQILTQSSPSFWGQSSHAFED